MRKLVDSNDPSWKEEFSLESKQIQRALGENVVVIHHIGSTSIPCIKAKPIVDILVEVVHLDVVDAFSHKMSDLDYEVMGEYGIDGRRYFRRSDANGIRAFHVHVYEQQSDQVERNIAFRDYLIAHPSKAKEYSDLKSVLAADGAASKTDYQNEKTPFIRATENDAIEWRRNRK